MNAERAFMAFVLGLFGLFALAGLAYVTAIVWAIIRITLHFT